MNTLPELGRPLRHWVNEPLNWYDQTRPLWLQAVHSARIATFNKCLRAGITGSPSDVDCIVNDFIGLMLMRRFVRQRSITDAEAYSENAIVGPQTIRSLCRRYGEMNASPLLQSVFDDSKVVEGEAVPAEAVPTRGDELAWFGSKRFPVTAFGDYHQLCLAKPLRTDSEARGHDERRSRGVHFTPSALVDYLTQSTLSRFFADEGQRAPRILDPSCGSGIFLIAALRFLAERKRVASNAIDCPIQEKLDTLALSIFGTDINARAIEWARRSLLLSVWEKDPVGEHSRLQIPELSQNLVAVDFLSDKQPPGFPQEFDAILGGPPFVRFSQLKRIAPLQVGEWRKRFSTARSGQFDLYIPFFEQAVRRLKSGGQLGWSASNTFLRSKFGQSLREFLGSTCSMLELVEFENPKVYADAVTQIVLVQMTKATTDDLCRHIWVRGKPDLRDALDAVQGCANTASVTLDIRQLSNGACRGSSWRLSDEKAQPTPASAQKTRTLKQLDLKITQGVVTGADAAFMLRVIHDSGAGLSRVEDRERRQHLIESELLRPAVRSREIRGYERPQSKNHLLLPYDKSGRLLSEDDLLAGFPRAHSYLSEHRHEIPGTGKRNRPFYAFRNDAVLRLLPGPRIIMGMVTSASDTTLDLVGESCPHAGVLVLSGFPSEVDPFYLLGVFNCHVFWAFVQKTMPTMGNGRHVLRRGPLAEFPVVIAPHSDQAEIAGQVRQLLKMPAGEGRAILKRAIDENLARLFRFKLDSALAMRADQIADGIRTR